MTFSKRENGKRDGKTVECTALKKGKGNLIALITFKTSKPTRISFIHWK